MKNVLLASFVACATARFSEVWTREQEDKAGIVRNNYTSPLPHHLLDSSALPESFSWCDKDGVNYCTSSLNQHLPQYCGSCWAHGAISALGDRIKIARGAKGADINLAVQHVLNCGNAGSCHGGSVVGPYQWIHKISAKTGSGIAYASSNPYMACSSESSEGICRSSDWSCNSMNIARTCSTFSDMGGKCTGLEYYPNATVSEYGEVSGEMNMAKEIFARGPISCGIDAASILKYTGGISSQRGQGIDHVISVVGWGKDKTTGKSYWIVRNSWGEYWGEMGYIRVEKGNNALNLEEQCAWGVIGSFTETNFPCYEDGGNC